MLPNVRRRLRRFATVTSTRHLPLGGERVRQDETRPSGPTTGAIGTVVTGSDISRPPGALGGPDPAGEEWAGALQRLRTEASLQLEKPSGFRPRPFVGKAMYVNPSATNSCSH
jgi:hypothetical protein